MANGPGPARLHPGRCGCSFCGSETVNTGGLSFLLLLPRDELELVRDRGAPRVCAGAGAPLPEEEDEERLPCIEGAWKSPRAERARSAAERLSKNL